MWPGPGRKRQFPRSSAVPEQIKFEEPQSALQLQYKEASVPAFRATWPSWPKGDVFHAQVQKPDLAVELPTEVLPSKSSVELLCAYFERAKAKGVAAKSVALSLGLTPNNISQYKSGVQELSCLGCCPWRRC